MLDLELVSLKCLLLIQKYMLTLCVMSSQLGFERNILYNKLAFCSENIDSFMPIKNYYPNQKN